MSNICEPFREPWHFFPSADDGCMGAGGDIAFSGGDFARGDALASAVLMQLLTDKSDNGVGGWWGAYDLPFEPGSRLWLLRQKPSINKDTIIDAERYVREALDPLIAQGLASRYEVDVRAVNRAMKITVEMFDDGGNRLLSNTIPWVF